MSEETKQDWKEARIAEYAKLEANKKAMEKKLSENTEIATLKTELALATANLSAAEKPYYASIDGFVQQQTGIKVELVDRWYSEDKTFECAAGTVTLRTTKSLNILSKEKLIEFLTKINKLPDFIKTFEITKLRKIMDAGLLESDIASYDEKKSIAIKITETEQ